MKQYQKKFSKTMAAILSALLTVPVTAPYVYSQPQQIYQEGIECVLVSDSDAVFNVEKAKIDGSIYARSSLSFFGSEGMSVNGSAGSGGKVSESILASEKDSSSYQAPDLSDVIEHNADYKIFYEGDPFECCGIIDISQNAYIRGGLVIDEGSIKGSGYLTAEDSINIRSMDNSECEYIVLYSKNGDIIITGSELTINGILYAPKGRIILNVKKLTVNGGIYAEDIELNGTELSVNSVDSYRELVTDHLTVEAGEDREVYVGESIVLEGSSNYDNVNYIWSSDESVAFENAEAKTTSASFSRVGTYTVTLKGSLGKMSDSDTLTVKVNPDPSKTFTTTSDFSSGKSDGTAAKDGSLILDTEDKTVSAVQKSYLSTGVSGINVDSSITKDRITSSSDDIEITYDLKGVGSNSGTAEEGIDFVFLIDNSGSMYGQYLENAKAAAKTILSYMREGDRYAISDLGRVHLGFTDDKELIEQEINRVGSGSGSSETDDGINIVNQLFDEQSTPDRQKYMIVLADGEACDWDYSLETMMKYSQDSADRNIKIYSLAMRNDMQNMQESAKISKGIYKNCPDAEAIKKFMEKLGGIIFNSAARNVILKTTAADKNIIDFENIYPAPSAVQENDDGSADITWNFDSFEIDQAEKINIPVRSDFSPDSGYEKLTYNTALYYNDKDGKGQKIYLDDISLPCGTYMDSGEWSDVYDSGREGCKWTGVYWNGIFPSDSSADFYVSASDDNIEYSEEIKVTNYTVPENLCGRYIRVRAGLHKGSDGSTPVIEDITVISGTMKLSDPIKYTVKAAFGSKGSVSANRPVTLYADINSNSDRIKKITWKVSGDGEYTLNTDNILMPVVYFANAGKYNVTLRVEDEGGSLAKCTVSFDVDDEETVSDIINTDGSGKVKFKVEGADFSYPRGSVEKQLKLVTDDPSAIAWVSVRFVPTKENARHYQNRYNYEWIYFIDEDLNSTINVPNYEGYLDVTAYDWSGNQYTFTCDTFGDETPPEIEYVLPEPKYGDRYYTKDPLTIKLNVTDNYEVDHVELMRDNDPIELDENYSYTFTPTESMYSRYYVTAYDKAGNYSRKYFYVNVYDDNNSPRFSSFSLNRTSACIGNEIVFKAAVVDYETGLKSVVYTLNDKEITLDENGEYKYIANEAGEFVFKGVASDYRDNTIERTASLIVREDTYNPYARITATRNKDILVGTKAVVTVTASDNVGVTKLDVDVNGTNRKLDENGQFILTAKEAGPIVITAVAYDAVGNSYTANYRLNAIDEDTVPPQISFYPSSRYEYSDRIYTVGVTSSDNTKVVSRMLFLDGKEIGKNENTIAYPDYTYTDYYSFNPYQIGIGEHTFRAVTTDESGNKTREEKTITVSDTTAPYIEFSGQTYYNTDSDVEVTIGISDCSKLASVTGTLNDKPITLKKTAEQKLYIPHAPAGTYVYSVTAEDIYGNKRTTTRNITVRDTIKPVITLSNVDEEYFIPDVPVIRMTVTDNVGVTGITVKMNGNDIEYDGQKLVLPKTLDEGNYTINISARDAVGNSANETISFRISKPKDVTPPVIEAVSIVPENPEVGSPIKVYVTASDDSGSVDIEVSANGTKFEYKDGAYVYTPDTAGDITVTIKASDPSENVTEINAYGHVSEDSTPPAVTVDYISSMTVNTSQTITVSAEDNKGTVTLALQMNGSSVALSGGKYKFKPDSTGKYSFTAAASDSAGNVGSMSFEIEVTEKLTDDDLKKYLKNEGETALSKEMKDAADKLKTAVGVYDYVRNSVVSQFYQGSRKGASATFEQLGGNDADTSSLMIAMMRYLKYPARYVKGTVQYSEKELLGVTGADNWTVAVDIINASGYDSQTYHTPSGNRFIRIEHIWTEVYAPLSECGLDSTEKAWIALDGWLKSYKFEENETENPAYQKTADVSSELLDLLSGIKNTVSADISGLESDLKKNIDNGKTIKTYSKKIIGQKPEKLPTSANFSIVNTDEKYAKIADTDCDTLSICMNGSTVASFKTNELGRKRILIQYLPADEEGKTLFEQKGKNWKNLSASSFYVVPVVTVDGSVVGSGTKTTLGQTQQVTITSYCSGNTRSFNDSLVAGSMYAVVVNTYDISAYDIAGSYNNMLNNALSKTEYGPYSEEYLGALLDYMGKMYFSLNDMTEFSAAQNFRVMQNPDTAVGLFGYEFGVTLNGWTQQVTGSLKDGFFMTDIDCLRSTPLSLSGNKEDINQFALTTGMLASYYEGYIWEYLTESRGISTVSVLWKAQLDDIDTIVIDSGNKSNAMGLLSVSDEVRADISNYIDKGYTVMIPQKNVTIDDWTGTGYLMFDPENMSESIYRLSGGKNGGSAGQEQELGKIVQVSKANKYHENFEEMVQAAYYIRVAMATIRMEYSAMSFAAAAYASAGSFAGFAGEVIGGGVTVGEKVVVSMDAFNLGSSGSSMVTNVKSAACSLANARELLLDYYSGNEDQGLAQIVACVEEYKKFCLSWTAFVGDTATLGGALGTLVDSKVISVGSTITGFISSMASALGLD